jgi:tetratricopeptide (TPR) repeat protein
MKRLLPAVLLAFGAALAVGPAARAQTSDSVRFFDREAKKERTVNCAIEEETPAHLVIREGARNREIPAADVIDVGYDRSVGSLGLLAYRRATNHEHNLDSPKLDPGSRQREFESALDAYREVLGQVKEPAVRRHVQFCIGRLLVRRAEDDPKQVGPAIEALQKFVKDYRDGWQLTQAVRLLGQLQEGQGDYAGAEKTYEDLAKQGGVARETREECDLLVARMLLRNHKPALAQERLEKLVKALAPTDPEANKAQVYLAQCQVEAGKLNEAEAKLKAMLAGSLDASAKGLVYNALGDVARQRNKPEDAFWNYLWVDVVYNQDRHEQAKALYYLSKLFVQVKNDPVRALQCRQRLLDKDFLGMEYQKLAAKEKPE